MVINVGDWVIATRNKLHPSMMGKNKKLIDKYEGPYIIVGKINDLVYDIKNLKEDKIMRLHINRLKRFISSSPFHENNNGTNNYKHPATSHGNMNNNLRTSDNQ